MIPILYESTETAFTSNGLHRLIDTISCVVVEERNSIYECNFEYPVNGQYYDEIKCGRIIGVKHDDSNDIQPFDIVSFTKPIDGIVSFHAVHISYRLKGYVVLDRNIESLSEALSALTSTTPSNPFTFSADFTANGYAAAFDNIPKSVRQVLGGVEGSILDAYGGEYEWDKFSVILHNQRGTTVDFAIRYGYNMVDYNDETDYSDTYTSAIPYWIGQDENGNRIRVIGDKVSSGLTPYDGREKCVAMDLSENFEDEPTSAELEAFALAKMQGADVNNPRQSIKVDFVRLQDFSEYSSFESLLQCKLCDKVLVVFPDYQTSAYFKIVRTEYDVLEERFTSMELGTLSVTLAEALGVNNDRGSYKGSSGGGGGAVTGVKGDAELTYRTGNVNLTAANIGALPSNTAIHNVPSGGSSGQVLAKASGTDYDLTWVNQSGGGGSITDVQVNGTSVVSSGVANIPPASSSAFGVIRIVHATGSPLEDDIRLYYGSNQNDRYIVPNVNTSTYEIKAYYLPEATTSMKGALSSADKTKLDGIASGAEVNVQSNWTEADSSSDAYILNKPTIPTVNDATLTIKKNGTTVNTFTANASTNVTADISVPATTSDLFNDSGFVTSADLPKEYDFTSSLTPSIDARGVSRAQYAVFPTDTSSLTSANGLKISAYLDYDGTIFYPLSVVYVEISSSLGKFNIYVKSFRDSVQSTSSTYVSGTLHIVAPFQISSVSTYK